MKTKNQIVLFLSLLHFSAYGAEVVPEGQVNCGYSESSLDVLSAKPVIEDMNSRVMKSACNENLIYKNISDRSSGVNHTDEMCAQIKLCSSGIGTPDSSRDAKELLKSYLPKAALLGILTKEIKDKKSIQQKIKAYEIATKEKICPVEVVDADCEKSIRNSLIDISGSNLLSNAPLSSESIPSFVSKHFFSLDKKQRKEKATKAELKALCKSTISYNQICKKQAERISDITDCENNPKSVNCLGPEQAALGVLVSKHLSQKEIFYAMENELCSNVRVVQEKPVAASIYNISDNQSGIGMKPGDNREGLRMGTAGPGMRMPARVAGSAETAGGARRAPASTAEVAADTTTTVVANSNKPDASNVKAAEEFKIPSSNRAQISEEIKGFESRDTTTLSEAFSRSLQESVGTETKVLANTNSAGVSSDFAGRFNTITEEEKLKKEAEAQKKSDAEKALSEGSLSSTDKKKQDELAALNNQISSLKNKLEDMSQRVEDLKAKKAANPALAVAVDKESLEREKNIAELKKKVAELEADKKSKEANSARLAAVKEDDESARLRAESIRHQASIVTASTRAESTPREVAAEREKVTGTNSNYNEGRSPASLGSTGTSQTATSALVLKQAGTLATTDSTVVYMTANEFQKYPLHLRDSASTSEIETMLKGNAGSSIIVGDSEQIIPIMENGAVALDEKGNVKFKRVKISLVKNEKERKQNIAREISSVGDLKIEEQKKRDLIRYQEMKKSLQIER